jgi:Methyltransferase domain
MQPDSFIDETVGSIPGWLSRDAAYLTRFLVEAQREVTVGSLMEIGVFGGKYLSVLYHSSKNDVGANVLGIDIFTAIPENDVSDRIRSACGDTDRLILWKADSTQLSADLVLDRMRGVRPRFVSVDGLHTAEGVHSDLALVEKVIGPAAIVAVDDFLNPLAIGVCNGVFSYFLRNTSSLVPLVYSSNKLYFCTRPYRMHYAKALAEYAQEHSFLPTVQDYNSRSNKGVQWIEQEILAKPVIIM